MTVDPDVAAQLLAEVLRRTHLSAPADLSKVAAQEARRAGGEDLVLYLIDYEQRMLVPVAGEDVAVRDSLAVDGTVAGRSFSSSAIHGTSGETPDRRRLWLPLLDGTERLGVVEVTVRAGPGDVPPSTIELWERLAHLLAQAIITKANYSDVFEIVRRRRQMTIAAELLWELSPPLVFATDRLVIAGMLEPCYDNGGDAFDYAYNEHLLHFAVFDAMGHGLAAAGAAAFAVSAYRHSRRSGLDLAATHAAMHEAVGGQFAEERFVTAVLAELDVVSGRLRWVCAGHPRPLLIRGARLVRQREVRSGLPLGVELDAPVPVIAEETLEPGDLLLLYTDGLTEARRPGGGLFSVERLGEFVERQAAAGQAAPETLRRLRHAIMESQDGKLQDDATAVLVEWRRGSERALLPESV